MPSHITERMWIQGAGSEGFWHFCNLPYVVNVSPVPGMAPQEAGEEEELVRILSE